jgi:hypothetical protein
LTPPKTVVVACGKEYEDAALAVKTPVVAFISSQNTSCIIYC